MPDLPTRADEFAFDAFIQRIVASVIRGDSLEQTWAVADQAGPALLTGMVDPKADASVQRSVYRAVARAIVDRMPRPSQRFAACKTRRPGRNDACDCGSGRKYKHCCASLEHAMPADSINLLGYVLNALPRKRWAELAGSAIDPQRVAATAMDLADDGDDAAVIALLEPWFKSSAPIPAAHEPLLDVLLDAYTELGNTRKKQRLLEAALARGDRVIRSSVLQRLATIAADDCDFDAAWRHFQAAQREHPDSNSLATLEVVLLTSQGETAQARQRARFWIARLGRVDAAGYADLIGFLQQVVEEGEVALLASQDRDWPELAALRDLIGRAPALADLHHLADGDDESAGRIRPAPALRKPLARWQRCFPQTGPALTALDAPEHPAWDDTPPWLECLRDEPLLWQSFDVLDDLVLALTAVPAPGVQQALAEPLLARAETLFERLIESHNPDHKPVEWAWLENRPALRLLAQRIAIDLEAPSDRTVARIERMLALNPNDNHGFRSELASAYLRQGEFERAEQLARRYENDSELRLSHALTLWATGRADEALVQLQHVHGQLPRVLPMLLAKSPRKPRIEPGIVSYGGADQAWLLRERWLPAWKAVPGALDWLRTARRALR